TARDDLVGVDVIDVEDENATRHYFHPRAAHRGSTISPASAAAATIAGDIRCVRPSHEPWRPRKFRFDDDAQTSAPRNRSSFMPQHIEHPLCLKSKPADRNTSSSPRSTAACRTRSEPGTTSARTLRGTVPPSRWIT